MSILVDTEVIRHPSSPCWSRSPAPFDKHIHVSAGAKCGEYHRTKQPSTDNFATSRVSPRRIRNKRTNLSITDWLGKRYVLLLFRSITRRLHEFQCGPHTSIAIDEKTQAGKVEVERQNTLNETTNNTNDKSITSTSRSYPRKRRALVRTV